MATALLATSHCKIGPGASVQAQMHNCKFFPHRRDLNTTNCRAYYSIVLIAQLAVKVHAIALALTWQLA